MLKALLALLKTALIDAVKEKVTEMTKDEAKELLAKFGVRVEEITDEALAYVEAAKEEMDTETRRRVRKFWIGVTCVFSLICFGIGYMI